MAAVVEVGSGLSGLRRDEHHHAVRARGERAGHLEGEVPPSLSEARLHVHLAAMVPGEVQVHRHRRFALAPRVGDDGISHGVDRGLGGDRAPDLVDADDSHAARIRRSVGTAMLRPEITATAGETSFPAFPVRIAATVTADEGSMTY